MLLNVAIQKYKEVYTGTHETDVTSTHNLHSASGFAVRSRVIAPRSNKGCKMDELIILGYLTACCS